MNSEFEKFIRNAKRLGLCDTYSNKVDNALSKKQQMDIALDSNGVKWMCNATASGWGLTADYLTENYTPFLNGRYVYNGNGYTSSMYCQSDDVNIETTTAAIIECNGDIQVDRISELHIVNSVVTITGKGKAYVYLYNSTITNQDEFNGVIREDKKYG
jgi:hypothetical protein